MSSFVKSANITGNSVKQPISYQFPPSSGLLLNKWRCSLKSVCVKFGDDFDDFISVSCNLISDYKVNSNGYKENFHPPLTNILLSGKKNQKKIFNLENTWFEINSPNELIEIYLVNTYTNNPVNKKADICFHFLVQKFL